ncbi:trypsin-like peptidase domain-containing protein [Herbiconiux sp. KACC 21604]|uniref:S1C family serine protease n=1 Tax=unclassified Herbiconiux TaxID=2618217 RepID=UPI0014914023|nr:trypsin-like peptidase domain-containing protein [Herbiconiux sp. SALV-R1]QJU55398.1 trypsin-like serine protease [Herbiconiux sp. SALV-R1]WPO86573.1 trypsin-like peptidase domain-containing protein [Herbiconiux sp. KACC 21604]
MNDQPAPSADRPAFVIAHTTDGPVIVPQADAAPGRAPRRDRRAAARARRRRVGLVAGVAAAVLVVGAGAGGTAYAVGQATSTAIAGSTQATVVDDGGASVDGSATTTLPGSGFAPGGTGTYGSGYGYGTYSGGPGTYGNGSGSGTATGTGTTTDAVAASTAQTAGVVTIVSDLSYQGAASAGTGIILSSGGLILTNNHVVEGSTAIEVTDELTGASYSATVVGTDATHDIAVLQLEGASGLTTAQLGDSDTVAVGDAVTAIGNAEGTGDLVAASGTVTALDQTITTQSEASIEGETLSGLIQVDADIVSGDSGGPLVNASGEVVGIDTAASSGSAEITGFAIPLSDALDIVSQIEAGVDTEYIEIGYPGFLGISVAQDAATSTSTSSRTRGTTGTPGSGAAGGASASGAGTSTATTTGATVAGVIDGTPAVTAGLAAGDVITAVNGQAVASSAALTALLGAMEPGEQVTLAWTTTSGTTATATVTLVQGPAA